MVLEAGGAPDELARGSRRAQAKINGAKDMLNVGTGNLHDDSSWAVSHHSTQVEACSGDVTVTIGSRRRQVVTYRTKKERRGTETGQRGGRICPKCKYCKNTHAHTIYP